jgi:uncharacterized integral membrane protein
VLALAAAARRGDLTGRGHEDGKKWKQWLRQFERRHPQRPHAWPERAIQRDIARTQMRWFYMAVVAALAAATLIFAVQNLGPVTISFLGMSMSAPLALLVIVIYLLGMATGGGAWALMRWALEGSKRN